MASPFCPIHGSPNPAAVASLKELAALKIVNVATESVPGGQMFPHLCVANVLPGNPYWSGNPQEAEMLCWS